MDLNYDFVILTINNRGLYSALDLASKNKKVAWIDLSEKTCWTSKDFSGPLPFHIRRDVDEKDRRLFLSQLNVKKIDQGLSLLTEEGVLELAGPINHHQLEKFNQPDDMSRLQNSYSKTFSAMTKDLKNHWLVHFFSAYNKSVIQEESLAPRKNLKISDVFGETYFCEESFSHRQNCRRHLESQGVDVVDPKNLEIRNEGEKFFIKTSDDRVFGANKILCYIEASDVYKIDPEFSQQIFLKKPTESTWQWSRMDLSWQTSINTEAVPHGVVLLSHWDLPWLEENFMVLRKEEAGWSLWAKTKTEYSHWPEELKKQFVSVLKNKLGPGEFELKESERNKGWDLRLYPVYEEKPQLLVKKSAPFHLMGFDKYPNFDIFDNFQGQKDLIDQLLRSEM